MLWSFILFAQEEAKKGAAQQDPGILGVIAANPLIPIIGVFILLYIFVLMPMQRRQREEADAILANLKKNDEVETSGGIFGIVSHISDKGDEVTIKIDDNARMRVRKSAIVRIINKEETAKEGAAPTT